LGVNTVSIADCADQLVYQILNAQTVLHLKNRIIF